ncbi:MAG: Signal peptidase IB [Microgenomates group bacterium ADurb.Bin219]|nr:MAG: Signal peptidase IB [Microgenomates group bacterium ADurb.Bin219]HNP89626.1 signal peptidase I [Candidatus Woesebacteria bacterium]
MVRVFKAIGAFFLDIIQTIVLALSVFIIIYLFLVQPHQVKGSSMYPNFHDGEFILTNKVSYRLGSPKRGDVIIFKAPAGEPCAEIECEYIKRIIGLPGDRVKVQGGSVFINGSKLNESYLANGIYVSPGSYLLENLEKEIPENEYLALGDNRSQSRDGREFGPISKEDIIGKAWVRYWPFNRFGAIKGVEY